MNFTCNFFYENDSKDNNLEKFFGYIKSRDAVNYQDKLLSDFNRTAEAYFNASMTEISKGYKLNTDYPRNNYSMDVVYLQNPKYDDSMNDTKGIIFYHCGEIDANVGEQHTANTSNLTWDKFNATEGQFQIYVSQSVLAEVLNDVSKSGSLHFVWNETDAPAGLGIVLNVGSLGRIIPGIYNTYSRDESITLYIKLTETSFSLKESIFHGSSKINVKVHVNNNREFEFDINVIFNLEPTYNNQILNFNFFYSSLQEVKIAYNPYGHADLTLLKQLVTTGLSLLPNNTPLFQKIDLSSFYTSSDVRVIPNTGILIYGSPLVQSVRLSSLIAREFLKLFSFN